MRWTSLQKDSQSGVTMARRQDVLEVAQNRFKSSSHAITNPMQTHRFNRPNSQFGILEYQQEDRDDLRPVSAAVEYKENDETDIVIALEVMQRGMSSEDSNDDVL